MECVQPYAHCKEGKGPFAILCIFYSGYICPGIKLRVNFSPPFPKTLSH